MIHPVTATRTALVTQLQDTVDNCDVLDWHNAGFSKATYIHVGDMRAQINRETIASQTRLMFGEYWDITLTVGTGPVITDAERSEVILEIIDQVCTYLAGNATLDGVESLVFCRPSGAEMAMEDEGLLGKLTLSCKYRVNRR